MVVLLHPHKFGCTWFSCPAADDSLWLVLGERGSKSFSGGSKGFLWIVEPGAYPPGEVSTYHMVSNVSATCTKARITSHIHISVLACEFNALCIFLCLLVFDKGIIPTVLLSSTLQQHTHSASELPLVAVTNTGATPYINVIYTKVVENSKFSV